MGSRVPVEQYDLSSAAAAAANSYIGTSLHDLNSGDEVTDPAADDGTDDNDDRSSAVVSDCMHEPYQSSIPLHSMGVEDDRSSLENNGSSCGPYSILTVDDVSPIETARARFLDIIVDHFIDPHVIEISDYDTDYMVQQPSQENLSKRKSKEVRYEGDARYALPLMYVANVYETLVNEVNMRLSSMTAIREKTIGVALEASGGLYRKLAKKFPRKGTCIFKRRELATSFETRSKFPELVIQEEKRVRFVVVNGLAIVENPTKIGIADAEWFKRLTGRNEVAVSARDYKFYAPRHKYRRVVSNSNSNMPGLPAFPSPENSSSMATSQGYRSANENSEQTPSKQHMQTLGHQGQFHPLQQSHHHHINHATHFMHGQQCVTPPQLSEMVHNQQPSAIAQQIACLQSLGHVGGRMHVLPTSPAKYCDECGVPYLRETSKFCSECGTKRLGT
ncbi:PPR containing protein [Perilla frutescens var. hirtella]|uniref:PPR containing protein n=1 Tax=Perilla frutescens var. hirtella TaxID=608512 RepID=A0AAD4PA73_PERFH|nr:PPR containing protein [Perilla frutescens var. hirtella]